MKPRTLKKLHTFRKNVATAILVLFFCSICLVFVMPTVLTFTNSLMSKTEIAANYGQIFSGIAGDTKVYVAGETNLKLIPDRVTFSQYENVLLKNPQYLLKFWNAVILTVPIVVFQIFVALFAAYGFARFEGKIRSLIFFTYVILMLMPYQVTLVPNYIVTKWMGIFDTSWAIVLPGIFSPFAVYLLTRYMMRIPAEYTEAAQLDGAGEWKIFTRIYLPQCKSSLYAVVLLIFFDYWNMVEQPLVLLENEELFPLSIYISTINQSEVGLAFAAAVVYMIPCLLLFLHGEEHLEAGIVTGGMK